MNLTQQAWQWAIQHPEISIMVAFSLLTLVRRRHTSIVQWVRKNPRRAGLLKVLQAVFPDPLKLLDGLLLVLTGKMSVSKAKRLQAILDAILGAGIVLAMLGCQSTLPIQPVVSPAPSSDPAKLTVQETVEKAYQGVVLTEAALAAADAFLPEGTGKRALDEKRVMVSKAKTVLELAGDDIAKVCSELPPLVDLARGLQCPRCAAILQSAIDGGCEQ